MKKKDKIQNFPKFFVEKPLLLRSLLSQTNKIFLHHITFEYSVLGTFILNY